MARSYPPNNLSTAAAAGVLDPLARIRLWLESTLHRARTTVLPEPDSEHASHPGAAPGTWQQTGARLGRRLFAAVVLLALLLAIALVVFRVVYADRVYPAVVIGDVPVGGLTVAGAQDRLIERAEIMEHGTIAFAHEGHTWTPSLSDLGVTVDLDGSLSAAQSLGRGDNATSRLGFVSDILENDQVVPLRSTVDQRALNAWFDRVDQEIDRLPVDARIEIDGTVVSVVPGTIGLVVDREAATRHILDALSSLDPVTATLPLREATPGIAAEHLLQVTPDVEAMIQKPVVATFEDQEWTIDPATVTPYLAVAIADRGGHLTPSLSVDTDGLARALREMFAEVNRKPVDAVFGWDDGLVVIESSVNGAALRSDAFARSVGASFLHDHAPVKVPVVVIAPEIDSTRPDAYGITEQLGGGHSNYAGGTWERDENIRVGTDLLDHTLVPPGGTFSFNGAIGEITAGKGYQEAMVVSGEAVGRDVGGGVCQVSTTVFRAALNAGMPIVEWYPHTYRLATYERDGWGPGFDASILQVGPNPDRWADFRFENYSDSWLLVEAWYTDTQVFVDIYGTSDGRSVEIDAWPMGDNAFGFTRIIRNASGGEIANRAFESRFK